MKRYVKGENEGLSNVWNKLFKLSIIRKNVLLFDENRTHGEDWAFCVKYFETISTCMALHKNVYIYKIDGTQQWSKYSTKLSYSLIKGHALMENINNKYQCIDVNSEEYCWFKRRFLNQIINYLQLYNCSSIEKKKILRKKEVRELLNYMCALNSKELNVIGLSRKDKIAFELMKLGCYKISLKILMK